MKIQFKRLNKSLKLALALFLTAIAVFAITFASVSQAKTLPVVLPSWQEGNSKETIMAFVNRVTTETSSSYVPPAERIAVFDNDGTLWSEKPFYFQLFFMAGRIKSMEAEHPEWSTKMPYQAILAGDAQAIAQFTTQKELAELLAVTHSGMTVEEFQLLAKRWLKSAKHPRFNHLFTECVFQPMLELLDYLRANNFKTFIVSGGGMDFIRAFAEEVYGIPPEQVVGSNLKTRWEEEDGKFVLRKLPELGSYDDKEGKPINIDLHIGRRPILAFGNSDGDLPMLQYTASGERPSLMLILHHDDGQREWAYDRQSNIGHLDKAWDEARRRGWTVVSIKRDFKQVYPFN
jgi:phosphoserine phosphatase